MRARDRLKVFLPLTLLVMFALLIAAFRSVTDSLRISLSVPFACVGAVALQAALG